MKNQTISLEPDELSCDYLDNNIEAVQKKFQDAYNNGQDCTKIQSQIDKTYRKANRSPPKELNLTKFYNSNWMSRLPDYVKHKDLKDITLPGTHDSGAYKIMGLNPLIQKNGILGSLMFFMHAIGLLDRLVKRWPFKNWAITQKQHVKGQLESGIRFLDIRIGKSMDGKLAAAHTLLCSPLNDVFRDIKQFTNEHQEEIVVARIKIDRPYKDLITNQDMQKLNSMMQKTFGDTILKQDENTTIHNMIKAGKKVKFYGDFNAEQYEALGRPDFIHNGKSTELWPNETTIKAVDRKLDTEMLKTVDDKSKKGKTVLLSVNTTPNKNAILKGTIKGDNLIKRGQKIAQDLVPKLAKDNRTENISTFMLDGVGDSSKAVKAIINMNIKQGKNNKSLFRQ